MTVARRIGAVAFGFLAPLGCGPVEYASQVGTRAADALSRATRDEAPRLAPYEYQRASDYFHEARWQAGFSAYELAIEYGRRCEDWADRARRVALERRRVEEKNGLPGPGRSP